MASRMHMQLYLLRYDIEMQSSMSALRVGSVASVTSVTTIGSVAIWRSINYASYQLIDVLCRATVC